MQDVGRSLAPDAREGLQPRQRVECVAPDEVAGAIDRPALALVLEAPVRRQLRLPREVQIEMGRQPRRARSACQHDAKSVDVLVLARQ